MKLHSVFVTAQKTVLRGDLVVPKGARGIVVFAHGSGSGRFSPRNRFVAEVLQKRGLATLLIDLLTAEEDMADRTSAQFRFNTRLLADRLLGCLVWLGNLSRTKDLSVGYFGASTGAAAALIAAAQSPGRICAVVSRGGRPDLAGDSLPKVQAPTLLIVGSEDHDVLRLNREAAARMKAPCTLRVVPGASHLFEENGTLEEAAKLAADWFMGHLSIAAEEFPEFVDIGTGN